MFLSIPAAGPPLSVVKTITELLYKPFASKASLTFLKEKKKNLILKSFVLHKIRPTYSLLYQYGTEKPVFLIENEMKRVFLLEFFPKIWNAVFDRNDRKFQYHLLFHTIPTLLDETSSCFGKWNGMERSFPLKGLQMLSNCTHSFGLILFISWKFVLFPFGGKLLPVEKYSFKSSGQSDYLRKRFPRVANSVALSCDCFGTQRGSSLIVKSNYDPGFRFLCYWAFCPQASQLNIILLSVAATILLPAFRSICMFSPIWQQLHDCFPALNMDYE